MVFHGKFINAQAVASSREAAEALEAVEVKRRNFWDC